MAGSYARDTIRTAISQQAQIGLSNTEYLVNDLTKCQTIKLCFFS